MKKTIIILAALVLFISTGAFAGETPGMSEKTEQTFKKNFPDATMVSWKSEGDFQIAEFREGEIKHLAYFDTTANLVAVIRYLNTDYLPLKAKTAIKDKYGDLEKINALEVSLTQGNTFYMVGFVHKGKYRTIKIYQDGSMETLKN